MPRGRPKAQPEAPSTETREEIENMTAEQLKERKAAAAKAKRAAESAEKARKRANRLAHQEKMVIKFAEHRGKVKKMGSVERKAYFDKIKQKRAASRKKLQGDLIFPVRKIKLNLNYSMGNKRKFKNKQGDGRKITTPSAVFMTAVVEYLTAEVLELSGEVAKNMKKQRIVPRHILAAIRMDEELNNFLPRSTMITSAGVMPKPLPSFLMKNNVPRSEWTAGPNDIFKPAHLYSGNKSQKQDDASASGDVNNNK